MATRSQARKEFSSNRPHGKTDSISIQAHLPNNPAEAGANQGAVCLQEHRAADNNMRLQNKHGLVTSTASGVSGVEGATNKTIDDWSSEATRPNQNRENPARIKLLSTN